MRSLQARAKKEEKAPPGDLVSAWQRAFGQEDSTPARREFKKVRERAGKLNDVLRAKGCPMVDFDQELSR
jgi:hypothetical protein